MSAVWSFGFAIGALRVLTENGILHTAGLKGENGSPWGVEAVRDLPAVPVSHLLASQSAWPKSLQCCGCCLPGRVPGGQRGSANWQRAATGLSVWEQPVGRGERELALRSGGRHLWEGRGAVVGHRVGKGSGGFSRGPGSREGSLPLCWLRGDVPSRASLTGKVICNYTKLCLQAFSGSPFTLTPDLLRTKTQEAKGKCCALSITRVSVASVFISLTLYLLCCLLCFLVKEFCSPQDNLHILPTGRAGKGLQ